MTLDDAILAATGGPTVSDGLWDYFFNAIGAPPALEAASLDDLERAYLRVQMPTEKGSNSDLWFKYLREVEGHDGTLNDMLLKFWSGFSAGVAPSNDVEPVITGTPQPGNTLTCSTGTWTGAQSYNFQWFDGVDPIIGSTQQTFTPDSGYVGLELSCNVTASNNWGSASMMSNSVTITA